ncbi:MAG: glycosyltransferase [Bacteroidetes bacterium]|nr:glycosyltransferase [Bacteroidota bacterium]
MMDYFFFFCGLIILLSGANYYFQIGGYKKGWESLKEEFDGENTQTKFSIIIPARNEKANILNCLNSIKNLDYPKENFEVIVVDDSSEDETAALVESFIAANPQVQIRLLKLGEVITSPINSYKKTAIAEAIKITKNDWLLTTDADCTYYPKWLKSFSSFIQKEKPVMGRTDSDWCCKPRQPKTYYVQRGKSLLQKICFYSCEWL